MPQKIINLVISCTYNWKRISLCVVRIKESREVKKNCGVLREVWSQKSIYLAGGCGCHFVVIQGLSMEINNLVVRK